MSPRLALLLRFGKRSPSRFGKREDFEDDDEDIDLHDLLNEGHDGQDSLDAGDQ